MTTTNAERRTEGLAVPERVALDLVGELRHVPGVALRVGLGLVLDHRSDHLDSPLAWGRRERIASSRMGAGTGAAVALALVAGLAGSIQVAVMGRFGARIGSF